MERRESKRQEFSTWVNWGHLKIVTTVTLLSTVRKNEKSFFLRKKTVNPLNKNQKI